MLSARENRLTVDVLSRPRVNRKGKPIPSLDAPRPPISIDIRTLDEQQAALNLAQLSGQGSSSVTTLVDTLVAEADPALVSIMARGNPANMAAGKLTKMDQQSLRAMLAYMEEVSGKVRDLLEPATPSRQTSPQPAMINSGGSSRDPGARVPSLTNSQSTEAEPDIPGAPDGVPNTLIPMEADKDIPSPATSRVSTPNGEFADESKATVLGNVQTLPDIQAPTIKRELSPAVEEMNQQSNADVAIVIDGSSSPEPEYQRKTRDTSTPINSSKVAVVIESDTSTDDKNEVVVTETRQIARGVGVSGVNHSAVEMADAPENVEDVHNRMDLD